MRTTCELCAMWISAGICGIGILWLLFLNWDISRCKTRLLKKTRPRGMSSGSANPLHGSPSIDDIEVLSTSTEMIFFQMNAGRHLRVGERATSMAASAVGFAPVPSVYRFMKGKHTPSFYLKCGMAGLFIMFVSLLQLMLLHSDGQSQLSALDTSFTRDCAVVIRFSTLRPAMSPARACHSFSSTASDLSSPSTSSS